jgi:hypothetical protein
VVIKIYCDRLFPRDDLLFGQAEGLIECGVDDSQSLRMYEIQKPNQPNPFASRGELAYFFCAEGLPLNWWIQNVRRGRFMLILGAANVIAIRIIVRHEKHDTVARLLMFQ